MRIVEGWEGLSGELTAAGSIGNFDGVHLGHQWLLRRVAETARRDRLVSAAITFRPHPQTVLRPDKPLALLTAYEEKVHLLAELGLDLLLILPFTRQLALLTAEEFFAHLVSTLRLRHLLVGPGFALGRGRQGTEAVVREIGHRLGFTLHVLPPFRLNGEEIRSSELRRLVLAGDVVGAQRWLGRPPTLYGTVVEGDRRGRSLGFPTANLHLAEPLVVPAHGVYACAAELAPFTPEARLWPAAANVGVRPTFRGLQRVIEAHLLGFAGDLYGQPLRLHFQARIREERRFSSPEDLVAQIHRDVDQVRRVLSTEY